MTVTLTRALADRLWHTGTKSFLADQRDRFDDFSEFTDPEDPALEDGRMRWCRTDADAVLLLAYEQAVGVARLLWDRDLESYVVLSSRSGDLPTS